MIRGLFKYECKQLHNFFHIYATTKCHTFWKEQFIAFKMASNIKNTHYMSRDRATYIKAIPVY